MTSPFSHISGPRSAKVVFVGEAWGESEARTQRPFAGASGREFWRMLGEAFVGVADDAHSLAAHTHGDAWLDSREDFLHSASIMFTNVFNLQPPGSNSIDNLCCKKADLPSDYAMPHLSQGKYIRAEYLPEVCRLLEEISLVRPNLVVALGNTACWALLQATNIGSIRGAITLSAPIGGWRAKTLPTYHPAAVLRMWPWRPIVVADLIKARREMEYSELRRPERYVVVNPTLHDMRAWGKKHSHMLSVDIETFKGQISSIAFARSRSDAICVPFIVRGRSYWEHESDEVAAWDWTEMMLKSPAAKLFQNGLFDLQYLIRMGLIPFNCIEDTMLLHHALYPEMRKGLGFLGSIYSNEAAWKLMRINKGEELKRDE